MDVMRLTLRTLLAYLDNTLDPQDAESLRDKLSETHIAIRRIRTVRQDVNALVARTKKAAAKSQDKFKAVVDAANALVAKHGGKYLARTECDERLEGEGEDAALRIIIEWPSKEAAKAFMSDPAYQPHLKARTAGSKSHHFLIEGKDDLA